MDDWRKRLDVGSFALSMEDGKDNPTKSDPNAFSSITNLGNNLVILSRGPVNVTELEIRNTQTGDVIKVHVIMDSEFEDMWNALEVEERAYLRALLLDGKKISAIKLIRQALDMDLKLAKRFIDSKWLRDIITKPKAVKAVDNGDGTGSLKGKLVGMGF